MKKKHRRVVALSEVDKRAGREKREGESAAEFRSRSVLPRYGEGESPAAWGEDTDSNDRDLLTNRPPHWDRG